MKFRKVAILGTGLLGASFAFAAKNRGLCEKISAWSRSESTRKKCSILPKFSTKFSIPLKRQFRTPTWSSFAPPRKIYRHSGANRAEFKKGCGRHRCRKRKGQNMRIVLQADCFLRGAFCGLPPHGGLRKIGIDFADEKLFDSPPVLCHAAF